MFVLKRTLEREEVSFDKVLKRIKLLSDGLNVNFFEVAQKVCSRIYDGVKTCELDELAAQLCSSMIIDHPDYGTLASRIIISNHQKNTSPSFSETIRMLYENTDVHGSAAPLVSAEVYKIVENNKEKLNSYIDYTRDFTFDYFGFKTLEKAYLQKVNGKVIERPQHMLMRVALGIHGSDIKDALQTYDMMSTKHFVHATPTLFNSGTCVPQMSSCYLYGMHDSIEGIFKCLKDCAHISKYAGGIGLHIHNIRSRNSTIRGTNGISTGIVPMLRVYNNTARYVNQCFAPETFVITKEGTKRIDEIRIYDQVLTNDGTYQAVLQVSINNIVNEDILEFTSNFMSSPVRVTKVHELFVRDCISQKTMYLPAHEFDISRHMMGFPLETKNVTNDEITNKFLKFIAIFKQAGRVFSNGVDYSVCCTNTATYNTVIDVLKHYNARHWIYHNKSNSNKIVRFLRNAHIPSLDTRCALEYGKEGAKAFIEGLFMNSPFDSTYIEVSNKSNVLTYQVIAANAGILLSMYTTSSGNVVLKRTLNNMSSYLDNDNNMLWFKLDNVRTTSYTGSVYDLNVNDNHNYTTMMGLVHNSGRRNGSIAIYMEPWHGDVEHFIEMRKNHGNEEERARDLFYALWIPDLFMRRVQKGEMWSLMCPDVCKGLSDCYGEDFDKLYMEYEAKGMFIKQVQAQDLWFRILESQIETGTPYMLYKDHVNRKNMQKNIGIIKSSNLCSEIMEVSDEKTCAVCNLASVCLPTYVCSNSKTFDYDKLHSVVKILVKNLNKIIDRNFYPIEEAHSSNKRDRPIGIGVQGLADVFAMLKMPYESDEARQINKQIFETMYHAALEESMELAKKLEPYETFTGSPASQGILHFDLWNVEPSEKYNWSSLRENIKQHGLRNSLLIAPMPTASTSQVMGFTESFEPITSNIYKRKTLAGEFILVNKYLVKDLQDIGLWTPEIKNFIIAHDGSIQNITQIPEEIRNRYKTVWECKMRSIIDMAADRGAFIDQSQSMNLYVENPDFKKLTAMHFHAWNKGLKTGMYYLRSKAKSSAQKFTLDPRIEKQAKESGSGGGGAEYPVCETCSA